MRLLCFGDVHLGAGTDYGSAPYGPGSRLDDQAKVLKRIADLAQDEMVDGILFAGDAFHRRRPSPSEILVWRRFIDEVETDMAPVIAIDGNHDVVSADLPSALETVKPKATYEVIRRPTVHGLGGGVHVATLPWTPPARLVASRNGGNRDAIHDDVAELLLGAARELREEITFKARGKDDHVAILMLHWSVSGASTPSGIPTDLFREPVIPAAGLEELGFDFVVAGHIHKPQRLYGDQATYTTAFYTGSPCVIDFGEAAVEHGVWIIDTEDGSSRFVPVEDRPFVTLEWDADEDPDVAVEMAVGDFSAREQVRDAVVRVRYTATPEQVRRIDHAAIRAALMEAGASKVYAIQPTIIRADRARVEGLDESSDTLAAFEAFLTAQGIDGERVGELRERAATYLEDVRA